MDDAKRSTLEDRARSTEKTIPSKASHSAALEATIKAAELYLQALRLAGRPTDRKRLDAKCKELLAQAEHLKAAQDALPRTIPKKTLKDNVAGPVSTRKFTTREEIILLEGSKLNGFIFRPWTSAPGSDEFCLREGQGPFTDAIPLSLSSTQLESFDGWKRPQDAFPSGQIMRVAEELDLVQDTTSDCSVVASLCAGTSRVERGHPKILRSILHPYDYENDCMSLSPNGKYILKLYFNGCWRRVETDDHLPSSKTARVLHVIDRRHPGLLWPALVEKAYLKVRGGYDFPGSNSGTDLAVLTGWIPQQVFLHDEDVEPDRLWDEIFTKFPDGHVLITIGTGKLPRREQKFLGLAAEHDYAILDMSTTDGTKEVLVKNPWADGDVWKGPTRQKQRDEEAVESAATNRETKPGTFWMDFNTVFQYFENMYLNWNPALFTHRQDLHFSWQLQSGSIGNIFVDNPQFAVTTSGDGEIWLLLNRHFRTGDYTHATTGRNGYISLYLYSARDGQKVISSEGAQRRGHLVDSPNTLLRFQAQAGTVYTAVVVSQDLPPSKLNLTISALSKSPVALSEARLPYPQKYSLKSAWTRSAGDSDSSANYLSNPQFRLSLDTKQSIALVLRVRGDDSNRSPSTTMPDIHVKTLVVFSDGSRITRLRPRDVLAHSGDYRRGSAVVEADLAGGNYTVLCSTFDQNQYADFDLDLFYSSSSQQAVATPLLQLPADGSGRLCIQSPPALFSHGVNRLLVPLTVSRISRVTFVARTHHAAAVKSFSLFKMTLEQGQGPYKQMLSTSEDEEEEFGSVSSGLRMGDLDLQPSMCGKATGGLWLVLERLPSAQQHRQAVNDEMLRVDIFTDERLELGPWGLGEG